jgi:hypothetical protein
MVLGNVEELRLHLSSEVGFGIAGHAVLVADRAAGKWRERCYNVIDTEERLELSFVFVGYPVLAQHGNKGKARYLEFN